MTSLSKELQYQVNKKALISAFRAGVALACFWFFLAFFLQLNPLVILIPMLPVWLITFIIITSKHILYVNREIAVLKGFPSTELQKYLSYPPTYDELKKQLPTLASFNLLTEVIRYLSTERENSTT